jgi:hypothetical protein
LGLRWYITIDPALKRWAIVIQSVSSKEFGEISGWVYNQQQVRKEFL